MSFNGIKGILNAPGQIPVELVIAYFAIALAIAFFFGRKTGGLKGFTTLDLVYIGIGAAFSVVWEFYIGAFLDKFVPSTPFVSIGFWGRLIIVFIIVGLIRKVGAGMLTLTVYTLLSDIFHYGFSGEPLYFFYEALTYGLFLDLLTAVTGGKTFGIISFSSRSLKSIKSVSVTKIDEEEGIGQPIRSVSYIVPALEGALIGALWAIPDPIFYDAFLRPFIYGGYVDWAYVDFNILAYLPGDIIAGVIGGILAYIISKAVGQ
ncbi:hypothetical protein [Acidianus manzaensis]|uniref:Uncharacterized protein n=1 Tax=Acidianus manzaensis TaxID=282676 RepID=A0A1W6JZC1_9CREN|nr:hypothetical protein [Acidianus manzaensis]ARM75597.1 hypothetical protein B6F84_05790 [Acidianus manzaensis]